MRSLLALAFLACAACSAAAATDAASESNSAVSAPGVEDLSARLKAAYEKAGAPGTAAILSDVEDVNGLDLKGDARDAFNEYAGTSSWGGIALVGGPIAQVGTFEGHAIYFVAGDLSDTGSEWGFYDEDGAALAVAYGGQGEQPGPGGVDWVK